MRQITVWWLCALLLSGCAQPRAVSASACCFPERSVPAPVAPSALPDEPLSPPTNCVEQALVRIAATLPGEGQSERARAKAAYDYVIENSWFGSPVGLNIWQIRAGSKTPDYLESRALSPLLFGIGACEDYAAALTLLLRQSGLSARYIPGLTASVEGKFVDHAWVIAEIDGQWFHLDPQLEDNVTSNRQLTYRYFLKSDQTMLADHRWGENLIACVSLSAQQIEQVRTNWFAPACPNDTSAEPPRRVTKCVCPDRAAVERALAKELAQYEQQNGPLPPLPPALITPPVFGWEGYGNPAY